MAKPKPTVRVERFVLAVILVLLTIATFWYVYTNNLLTGSRASIGSNCKKKTFMGKCVMECRHQGETFTVPCPTDKNGPTPTKKAANGAVTPTKKPKGPQVNNENDKEKPEDPPEAPPEDNTCDAACQKENQEAHDAMEEQYCKDNPGEEGC